MRSPTFFFLFLSTLLFVGCCGTHSKKDATPYPLDEEKLETINYSGLVDTIFGYAMQLRYEKQLWLKQSCAIFDARIEKIRLYFVSQDVRELQEGRRLLVEVVEGVLERVNHYAGLHGLIRNHRFSAEDIELTIEFESFYGLYVDPSYVGRIDMRDGQVLFHNFSLYNKSYDAWGCKKESYALTRKLVETERRSAAPYIDELQERKQAKPSRIPERYIP